MATKPNWGGKARNLRIHVIDEFDEVTLIAAVNAWFVSRAEEEIVDIQYRPIVYGTPPVEHLHAFITYTEE